MRKVIAAIAAFIICSMIAGTFCYAGILPDLRENPVEKVISPHSVFEKTEPTPDLQEDGSYLFYYSSMSLKEYSDFGKAMAQEGYTLESSDHYYDSNAYTVAYTSVISTEHGQITVQYYPKRLDMKVTYSGGMIVSKNDPENPYLIDWSMDSLLQEIPNAVSIQSANNIVSFYDTEDADDGGFTYIYRDVSYDQYETFSIALEKEGFTLESNQILIDGTSRSIVTDGDITLIVDYNMDSLDAAVTYPEGVFARPADYNIINDGDTITLMEDVTMTVIGWEEVDSYTDYYYNTGWMPAKLESHTHDSDYDKHQIYITFNVDYNRTDSEVITDLLKTLYVKYYVYHTSYCNKGQVTEERRIYDDSSNTISEPGQFTFAIAFELNEKQMENLDQIAVTFNDHHNLYRYKYNLKESEE